MRKYIKYIVLSFGILPYLHSMENSSSTNFMEDVTINNALTSTANSLNKAASIIFNLKNITSSTDIENLHKILINLNLAIAALNREMSSNVKNMSIIQEKTDEVNLLSKLGMAVLKISLHQTNTEDSMDKSSPNNEIQEIATDIGLQEIFKSLYDAIKSIDSVTNNHSTQAINDFDINQGLKEILMGVINKNDRLQLEEKNHSNENTDIANTGLMDIFKNFINNNYGVNKNLAGENDKEVNKIQESKEKDLPDNLGLKDILNAIVRDLKN